MRRHGPIIAAILLMAFAYGAYRIIFNPLVYRYRITVSILTPSGTISGSAVREIRYVKEPIKLPESASVSTSQRGEAVVIHLPNKMTLFALVPDDGFYTMQAAFGDDGPNTLDAATADRRPRVLKAIPGRWQPESGYPAFGFFRDLRNPKSFVVVKPDEIASKLGPGYRIGKITVAMTSDPVTDEINTLLPWLPNLHGTYLDGTHAGLLDPDSPRFYHAGNFKWEGF
jgi:hypothetical protein